MRPTAQLHEIRRMKFLDVYERFESKKLGMEEAMALLGVSRSTFYRMRQRYDENGEDGLVDHRVGKPSPRRIPVDTAMQICLLYKTSYHGWTVKHFHEKLPSHGYNISYTTVKNILQSNSVIPKAPKRGKHRRKREPKPMKGMMLHQDGSTHEWVTGKTWDLIVTLDDATSEIYSMFFCHQEGTASSFKGLSDTFKAQGLPCSLYTDRGSHYFYTPKAGEKVAKDNLTQVGRALLQLGIEHIPADSPQARGRSERAFRTLQDRLPKELASFGITDMEEANRFLRERYMSEHNARFAREPEMEESAFCPLNGVDIDEILCVHEERVVSNDNTISYKNKKIQLDGDKYRQHYVRCRVCVHEYPDGSVAVFHGRRKLIARVLEKKTNKEMDLLDGFIALEPKLDKEMAEEPRVSPATNFGCQSALRSLPSVALSSDWQDSYRPNRK